MARDARDPFPIRGGARTVRYAVRPGGEEPARAEWLGMEQTQRAWCQAWFEHFAEYGQLRNRNSWKQVPGWRGLWQLRDDPYRVLCCFSGGDLVICSIVEKRKAKLRPEVFRRALQIGGEDIG